MGIGGSGLAGVAQIAKAYGFSVSGCDLAIDTPYIDKVKKAGISVFSGHDASHIADADLVAVSPAIFYQSDNHPETALARKKGILIKWQQFLGEYLHHGKFLICIAGTHGKSTTSALAGLVLEAAGLDPTVEVGATVPVWYNNVRIGKGKYFISEADEYHDNFASYHPEIIILNNIELDHPEYFGTFEKILESYLRFIKNIKPGGTLIFNANSSGNLELIKLLSGQITDKKLVLVSYNYFDVKNEMLSPDKTKFEYQGKKYELKIPGRHNIENALGIIELANVLNINFLNLNSALKLFSGIGRRLELLGGKKGIKIYDDYANHPTAFMATIQAVRQLNPDSRVWAVIEPHTFSRLRAVLPQLPASVRGADHVIFSKIYASREQDPGDFSGADISAAAKHPDSRYIPEFPVIIDYLPSHSHTGDVILVMGSGQSYKLSRQILENI